MQLIFILHTLHTKHCRGFSSSFQCTQELRNHLKSLLQSWWVIMTNTIAPMSQLAWLYHRVPRTWIVGEEQEGLSLSLIPIPGWESIQTSVLGCAGTGPVEVHDAEPTPWHILSSWHQWGQQLQLFNRAWLQSSLNTHVLQQQQPQGLTSPSQSIQTLLEYLAHTAAPEVW